MIDNSLYCTNCNKIVTRRIIENEICNYSCYCTVYPTVTFMSLSAICEQQSRWVQTHFIKLDVIDKDSKKEDKINPDHYKSHTSGVECIQVTEHMTFNLGNAIKYIWRNGLKSTETCDDDLKKAIWYIERELKRIKK